MMLNKRAKKLVDDIVNNDESLGCKVLSMPCGTLIIDAGIEAPGGYDIGLRMAEVCTGGLASVRLTLNAIVGISWPHVELYCDRPAWGCFASQAAHYRINMPNFRALGSGPACLLLKKEDPILNLYAEDSETAVLVLEADGIPDDATCQILAKNIGVLPINLCILIAQTSSLASCVQIAARSIETALHKLNRLGFDLRHVHSGVGKCPVVIPTGNNYRSLCKTNDAMAFGSQVWLSILDVSDQELSELVEKIPASSSPNYGIPFSKQFEKAGDFYHIDPDIFAPAEVTLANFSTGTIFHAGEIDSVRLSSTLLESER